MPIIFGKRDPWPHICSGCGAEFMGASLKKQTWCPDCRRKKETAQKRRWRHTESGREKTRAQSRRYHAEHHDQELERNHRRYAEHREAMLEYAARYREEHREIISLKRRARRGDHRAFFEVARMEGRLHTCSRLHLTALTLPCGKVEGACTKNCPDRIREAR